MLLAAVLLPLWLLMLPASVAAQSLESRGVVSLTVTFQPFDPVVPWNKTAEQQVLGNALVVSGHRLLTSANLVKNANLIEVRALGRYPDYEAVAEVVDYDADLALLYVEDEAFWSNLVPLPISREPLFGGAFTVNRWRSNGRFEQGSGELVDYRTTTTRFGIMEFPILRAKTNMSSLGRGEVLTQFGRVVGLVTGQDEQEVQATTGATLATFVAGTEPGARRPFAHRGFTWQKLDHEGLRRFLGLSALDEGVLVSRVLPSGTGAEELNEGDILTRVAGYAINPEGYIDHPRFGQMLFGMALNETGAGPIPVQILRNGSPMDLELQPRRLKDEDWRIAEYRYDGRADFEVLGGLVLQELTHTYLRAWGSDWATKAPTRLVLEARQHTLRDRAEPEERVVFVSRVLADPANLGYDGISQEIVTHLNGEKVRSLDQLREVLSANTSPFVVLEVLPGRGRSKLIFRADELADINARIRARYAITAE